MTVKMAHALILDLTLFTLVFFIVWGGCCGLREFIRILLNPERENMDDLTLQENWGPNLLYQEGIQSHNKGEPRSNGPVDDPKAIQCFHRGWDAAFEARFDDDHTRIYVKRRLSDLMVKYCLDRGLDHWYFKSDLPAYDRYVLVENKLAITLVGEFANRGAMMTVGNSSDKLAIVGAKPEAAG